jgi:hypothetical protein
MSDGASPSSWSKWHPPVAAIAATTSADHSVRRIIFLFIHFPEIKGQFGKTTSNPFSKSFAT